MEVNYNSVYRKYRISFIILHVRREVYLVWLIVIGVFVSTSVYSGEWYEGGTLHKATVQEWQQATYENRLATSGDWFVSITKAHNPELKKKLDALPTSQYLSALKEFAIQLEKCVSDIVNDKKIAKSSERVAEYASMCYITMYGIK